MESQPDPPAQRLSERHLQGGDPQGVDEWVYEGVFEGVYGDPWSEINLTPLLTGFVKLSHVLTVVTPWSEK